MKLLTVLGMTSVLLVVGGSLWLDESGIAGGAVLLVTDADRSDPQIQRSIAAFEGAGYLVTNNSKLATHAAAGENTTIFLTTRRAFAEVPVTTWATLYQRSAIVGGINVSLHELQPLADPGSRAGDARLPFTPERAIFSLLFSAGDCGRGAMSDWLDNWNVPGIIQVRAAQIAPCAKQ
jgi:hypothetical protein